MNVAILGCGGMGRLHAQMASNCGLRITVCADKVAAAATALAKDFDAKAMNDPMAAVKANIVVITTPTPTHKNLVKAAAAAGKHIFCEKPFGRTVAECKQSIAAAEKAGVKLFVGHVVRYFQEFEEMRRQMESGAIGKPGWIKMFRGGIFPGTPGSWFRDYAQSGGVTLDSMIHDLDWLRYAFGEPERLFCQALRRKEPVQLDYSQVTLRMENGMIATVIGTWAHPTGFRVKVEICGESGMIEFDSNEAPFSAQAREAAAGPSMIVPSNPVSVSPYQLEWEDFLGWIRGESMPRVCPEDGLRAVMMAEAALKSARLRQPVNL